jgi:peroxiredoxin
MVTGLVVQSLVIIALLFMVLQLLKQQGRILLRLDSLELQAAGVSGLSEVAVGTFVDDFQLPDLVDKKVSISDFRGRRVLLVYWSPECGFCDMLAADLAKLQPHLKENNTELVLVSFGDAESNQRLLVEHQLNCTTLLLEKSPLRELALFRHRGTPSAYLLDEEGRVLQKLAPGMDEVLQLAREAAAAGEAKKGGLLKLPLSQSQIVRDGLKAGTAAPSFSLPDLNGDTVHLDRFRGRKVLLVFSDPQCGPCDSLAPRLAELHRAHANNGMAVVMVGRGDAEQNRKKAKEHKMAFPVVIQEKWKLSRQYGIFATPAAFLIGNDGVIMRDVATGPDQIMALANEGLASH